MICREIPLTIAYKIIRYCGFLLCTIFIVFFVSILSRKKTSQINNYQIISSDPERYIEWGASPNCLFSCKSNCTIPFNELEKEILFLGTSQETNQKILLSLKQSGARKLTSSGEKIYLIYQEGKLHFSDLKTPLSISVMPHCDRRIEITVEFDVDAYPSIAADLVNTHRFVKSMETQYTISDNDPLINTPIFQTLARAKWWGIDYLFMNNSSHETYNRSVGQRLEFIYDKNTHIVYVEPNQYLIWGKNGWYSQPIDGHISPSYSVSIKKIDVDTLELILWDKDKLPIHSFFLPIYSKNNELPPIDLLSDIKKRTRTIVSFLIGKTRVTMKKGDFAVESSYGWRVANTQEEKNNIVSHKVVGSLFVFDGIEEENSNVYFLGRMFDSMRTSYQSIKIPIVENKRKKTKHTSRNLGFTVR